LGESIAEARRISHDLSPPMLDHATLYELLKNTIAPWKEQFKVHFHKSINQETEVHVDLKIQIIRIVQEIIINTHKHAEATDIFINLRVSKKHLAVLVRDNGKGFDINEGKKGIGLKNIELRMLYLKGKYKIKSGNKGTTTIIALNLTNFISNE